MNINRSTDSILQSILNALNVNRTDTGNKSGVVEKHQLTTFIEDSPDEEVKLEIQENPSGTQKVKEGEVGSVEFISSLIDIEKETIEEDTIKKDNQDRITYFEIGTWSYDIKYDNNGNKIVEKTLISKKTMADGTLVVAPTGFQPSITTYNKDNEKVQVKIIGSSVGYNTVQEFSKGKLVSETKMYGNSDIPMNKTIYNSDGGTTIQTFDSNGNLTETKNYDKNGNEIKDSGKTEYGKTLESIEKLLGKNFENAEIIKDNQGRITSIKNNTIDYAITYNDNGEIVVQDKTYMLMSNTPFKFYQTFKDGELIKTREEQYSFLGNDKWAAEEKEYSSGVLTKKSKFDEDGNLWQSIEYEADGKSIKSYKEFDKTGKDNTKIGSYSYVKSVIQEISPVDLMKAVCYDFETDKQGRVTKISQNNVIGSTSYDFEKDEYKQLPEYTIAYLNDGTMVVTKSKSTDNTDGVYKYNKNGKMISSPSTHAEVTKEPTPSVTPETTRAKEPKNPTTPTTSPNPTVPSVRTNPNQNNPQQNNIGTLLSQRIKNIQQQLLNALGNTFSRTKISSNSNILNVFQNIFSRINR